jgi:hypothetical protein
MQKESDNYKLLLDKDLRLRRFWKDTNKGQNDKIYQSVLIFNFKT